MIYSSKFRVVTEELDRHAPGYLDHLKKRGAQSLGLEIGNRLGFKQMEKEHGEAEDVFRLDVVAFSREDWEEFRKATLHSLLRNGYIPAVHDLFEKLERK